MSKHVNAAWIQPVSTDPALLVDRDEEQKSLRRYLDESLEAQQRDVQILVSGPRGVGKSIFTKTVLRQFARANPKSVLVLTVDGRGLRYREFLRQVADRLALALRERAADLDNALLHWADQLALLANADVVTRAQTDTMGRKYGVDATASTDLLLYKLQGRFAWEETRSLGTTVQSSFSVSDSLLHASILATLERLALPQSPWFVVVFYDDLDQALLGDTEAEVAPVHRRILDLGPCISLMHFRTEAVTENIAREVGERLELHPMQPEHLMEVLRARHRWASESVQKQLPSDATDWTPMQRLAQVTGNPLVFLRWAHALLRTFPWPPPPEWTSLSALTRLVFAADVMNGVDEALVHRLVEVVERCDGGRSGVVVHREDIVRGAATTHPGPVRGLSEQEVDDLIKLGVLLPRHRFLPTQGYRMIPVLDLLRASVRARL